MSLSRGLRNCNPGNIRITKDKWQGLRAKQEDKSFFQFETMRRITDNDVTDFPEPDSPTMARTSPART